MLALQDVKVDGVKAIVYAFPDRIEIVETATTRAVSFHDVARITTKSGLRKGRVTIIGTDDAPMVITGLRARDTPVAYRVLVQLAMDANA